MPDQTTIQVAAVVVQAIATAFIAATVWVYYRQLRAMREATRAQSILSLVNFLQDERVREARTMVRKVLKGKPQPWTGEEERAAARVCSSYDVAAIVIRLGLVPLEPFADNWGPSIKECYEILRGYIHEMQEHSGPDYWNDFGWLYERVVARGTVTTSAGGME